MRTHISRYTGNAKSDCNTVVLPKNLQTASGTLYEDFENAADWTEANGTITANTTEYKTGTQSIKLTTTAGLTATMTKTVNWDLSGDWGGLSFWMYVHSTDPTDFSGTNIYTIQLSNNSGVTDNMRHILAASQFQTEYGMTGWHKVYIPKSYFSAQASGTWASPIIRVRLSVSSASGRTPAISFDDLEIGEKHIPVIMMRFDDGYPSHYNIAYTSMRKIPGTLYLTTDLSSGITYNQCKELNAAGWAIADHTRSHTALKGLSLSDQQTAINNGITDLITNGLGRCSLYFAYPGGGTSPDYDANTQTAMINLGVVTGHTTFASFSSTAATSSYLPQWLPDELYGDNFHIRDQSASSTITDANLNLMVDITIASGTILCPLFHDVNGTGQRTTAQFQEFVNYLLTKLRHGLIYAITIDDYYKLTLGSIRISKAK